MKESTIMQKKTIRITQQGLRAFENEIDIAISRKSRTLKDVTNRDVATILANPGAEIEIVDSRNKVVATVAAGLGGAGIAAAACVATAVAGGAAAAGTAAAGAVVAGKSMALVGGGSVLAAGVKGAAVSAAIPGLGWIIAGGILAVTAVATTVIAINANTDKNAALKRSNEMRILYQKAIQKLTEEIRLLRMERKQDTDRYSYIVAILSALNPGFAPA